MVFNAASAIVSALRSRRPRPHVHAGVYYREGSNDWIYVPVSAKVVRGTPGRETPRDSLDPHWRVRTVVVDPSVNDDEDAPVHFAVHDPEELHPAADLSVSEELLDRIARRAQRALAA